MEHIKNIKQFNKEHRNYKPVYRFMKDDTQNKNTYNKQYLAFDVIPVHRYWIDQIANNTEISKAKQNGLFAYLTLHANAHSYAANGARIGSIWLKVSATELCKMLHVKTSAETTSILDKLKELNLINYTIRQENKTKMFRIYILGTETVNAGKNQIKADHAAIHNHVGYFYVKKEKINQIVASADSFSHADMMADILTHVVWNDKTVLGSGYGPTFFIWTHKDTTIYNMLTLSYRWHCSKSKVSRFLDTAEKFGYIETSYIVNAGCIIRVPIFADMYRRESVIADIERNKEVIAIVNDDCIIDKTTGEVIGVIDADTGEVKPLKQFLINEKISRASKPLDEDIAIAQLAYFYEHHKKYGHGKWRIIAISKGISLNNMRANPVWYEKAVKYDGKTLEITPLSQIPTVLQDRKCAEDEQNESYMSNMA